MGVREGIAWKNSPPLLEALKVPLGASSQSHEPQWTGPGEPLWFSVPTKYVPHRWQVLGASVALTSRGGNETRYSQRWERRRESVSRDTERAGREGRG